MTGISGSLATLSDELDAIAEPGQYVGAAVPEIRAHLQETAGSGKAPDGTPWVEKKSGGRAYINVMKYIDVRQISPTQAAIELTGPPVFGHYAAGDLPLRKIIPTEIDEKLGNAIARGVVKPYKERAK